MLEGHQVLLLDCDILCLVFNDIIINNTKIAFIGFTSQYQPIETRNLSDIKRIQEFKFVKTSIYQE